MNKIAHISVRNNRDQLKLISLKTIVLNRVSFFHEIFRINVELPDDLKFWSGILS